MHAGAPEGGLAGAFLLIGADGDQEADVMHVRVAAGLAPIDGALFA